MFSSPLSPELKKSHGTNSCQVRRGDTVKIMRGDRAGFEGKVRNINSKKYRIFVEGTTREKVDGTPAFVPLHPSKVMITRLNLDDKRRKKALERKRVSKTDKRASMVKKAVKEKAPKPSSKKEMMETEGE
jgi:large subunit ribosomal protein L24